MTAGKPTNKENVLFTSDVNSHIWLSVALSFLSYDFLMLECFHLLSFHCSFQFHLKSMFLFKTLFRIKVTRHGGDVNVILNERLKWPINN